MNAPSHLSELPIYKKALDIFTISHSISMYLNQDLSQISSEGKEDENIYFSGDIIQQSVSLVPHILQAELASFSDKKYKHAIRLKQLTNKLYRNCKRLENCNSDGKEYLPILRNELKKFKKLQKTWALTL